MFSCLVRWLISSNKCKWNTIDGKITIRFSIVHNHSFLMVLCVLWHELEGFRFFYKPGIKKYMQPNSSNITGHTCYSFLLVVLFCILCQYCKHYLDTNVFRALTDYKVWKYGGKVSVACFIPLNSLIWITKET